MIKLLVTLFISRVKYNNLNPISMRRKNFYVMLTRIFSKIFFVLKNVKNKALHLFVCFRSRKSLGKFSNLSKDFRRHAGYTDNFSRVFEETR